MPVIKVTYQSTVRRFSIAETTTWTELESNLRTLFSLPPTLPFSLSYTDEDGDVITLSTDLEIVDLLSNHQSNTTLRFSIVPHHPQQSQQSNNVNIISQTSIVDSEPSSRHTMVIDQTSIVDSEPSSRRTMVIDESVDSIFISTTPSISKGKQRAVEEDTPFESNETSSSDQQQPNEEQTRAPFIDLAQRFQTLLEQVRPVLDKNPQLVEHANHIMDQILQNMPVDIDMWDQWFKSHLNQFQQQNQNYNYSRQFSSFIPQNVEPWLRSVGQDIFNNPNCPFMGQGQQSNQTSNDEASSEKVMSQGQQNDQTFDDETLSEKLSILHSMGFWEDDEKNIELLKKYSGNISKVVEVLISIQNERIEKSLNLQLPTNK
ncbi:13875_t:CDS:1 [Cetraspora pellucida]|uniref:13875_t:CDS:1 n=1 Tax=Cetraspora pellucida TaxID=1433469 RepID=A0A9N9GU50_9GLOM|nr:13875_t:CDS:1 [Cetraspora pellucida]